MSGTSDIDDAGLAVERDLPAEVEVAVVGAGPHGLAAAAMIVSRRPSLAGGLVVLDPVGPWLRAWDARFAALEIPCLRSPGVHHPDPDPHALIRFAAAAGRMDELSDPFAVPATGLFSDFCATTVVRWGLNGLVAKAAVSTVAHADSVSSLTLADGRRLRARRVVLATNPVTPIMPAWAAAMAPGATVSHAEDVDLRTVGDLDGRHVVVVGGGLTAVHLALGAARRGARVRVLCRRALEERMFDTDPGWLGPKELRGFRSESSMPCRRQLIDDARGGGTVPPRWLQAVRRSPAIEVTEWASDEPPDLHDGVVWCATGWRLDVATDPVLASLRRSHPTPLHRGLPELTSGLAWPGTSVHLLGAYAGLHLGPTARNLAGARAGARAVTDAWWGEPNHRSARGERPPSAARSTSPR